MTRVVLDTNVLVSAAIFGGKPDQILNLARTGKIQLITSPAILSEFAGVLISKFRFSPERGAEAVGEMGSLSTLVRPRRRLQVVKDDDPDNRILECAQAATASYIVSGDSHLLALGAFHKIKVVSPAEFLDKVSKHPKKEGKG